MIGRCQNFEEVNMSTLPVKLLAQNTQFQGHVLLASFVWNAPTQRANKNWFSWSWGSTFRFVFKVDGHSPTSVAKSLRAAVFFFFFLMGVAALLRHRSFPGGIVYYIYIFIFHLLTTSCSFTFALHLFIIFQSVMFAIWKHPDTTGTSKAVGGTDQL